MKRDASGTFTVGKYSVDLDMTEVLNNVLDSLGKQKEKFIIHWLLLRLSGHQVELAKVLGQAFPELGKQMPEFFQKRVEDHRQSLRIGKLLSFRSASSIEEESVKMAWKDTRRMIKEVSMAQNGSIKALVDEHREILKRLCDAIIDLVMEEPSAQINLNIEGLRKFLQGGQP